MTRSSPGSAGQQGLRCGVVRGLCHTWWWDGATRGRGSADEAIPPGVLPGGRPRRQLCGRVLWGVFRPTVSHEGSVRSGVLAEGQQLRRWAALGLRLPRAFPFGEFLSPELVGLEADHRLLLFICDVNVVFDGALKPVGNDGRQ